VLRIHLDILIHYTDIIKMPTRGWALLKVLGMPSWSSDFCGGYRGQQIYSDSEKYFEENESWG
jgi:hypothetical protein